MSQVSKAQACIMPRPCIAEALTKHLEKTAYVVVGGPRGCGKTTGVLAACLSGKAGGVLRVKMTNVGRTRMMRARCAAIVKQGAQYARRGRRKYDTQTMLENVLRKTVAHRAGARSSSLSSTQRDNYTGGTRCQC